MVHDLRYDRIQPQLVNKGRDLRVEDEAFGGAAAVTDTADIDAVDDCAEPGTELADDFLLREDGSVVMR
jgi:hypothetical protein